MDDKRTPMEAEVQELPQSREPVCPEDFYGTAARPQPRRNYAGVWICVGLLVIAVCTFSVVAALLHVQVEDRDGGWRLSMRAPEATEVPEETVNSLDPAEGEVYISSRGGSAVRLPRAEAEQEGLTPSEIYARVSSGVVCVQVDSYYGSSVSTGVVISADGYILSAAEGLNNAGTVTVSFSDGSSCSAVRAGEDRISGVCLLKAEAQGLSPLSFSAENDLTVGQRIYCVCNPYGSQLPNVFYEGILSACGSAELGGRSYTLLQSSVQTREIGYGCPIFDSRGRVLGITTPIGQRLVSGEDPCFAVSGADLEQIMERFESDDSGEGLWLGLEVSEIPDEYRLLYSFPGSLWIDEVAAGSAPYGVLYQYDVITAVDGESVSTAEDFNRIISAHAVGDRVRLTLYRSGKWYTILLPVTER